MNIPVLAGQSCARYLVPDRRIQHTTAYLVIAPLQTPSHAHQQCRPMLVQRRLGPLALILSDKQYSVPTQDQAVGLMVVTRSEFPLSYVPIGCLLLLA